MALTLRLQIGEDIAVGDDTFVLECIAQTSAVVRRVHDRKLFVVSADHYVCIAPGIHAKVADRARLSISAPAETLIMRGELLRRGSD